MTNAHRPTIAVTQHAIAAGHYLATTAGFRHPPGGRQCDRCRGRRRHRARRAAERPGQLRRRRADHDLPRREARGRHHRRARHLAAGARPRLLHARARRQDPGRRAAHRRSGRARRLDHRAEALRHDELRRGRGGRDPARARRLPDVPADGRQPRKACRAPFAMAVIGGGLSAGRPAAADRRGVPPDRSRRLAAIHGRRGEGRRRSRPRGRARSRPRRVLSRRHRQADSSPSTRPRAACCRPTTSPITIRRSARPSAAASATSKSSPAAPGARGRCCCRPWRCSKAPTSRAWATTAPITSTT